MALKTEDIKRVKGEGFLLNRGTECFNGRIITENGTLTARQMICAGQAAEKFGNGTVAFTTRMTLELPGIPYEKIPELQAFLAQEGMVTGGTGAKVRPIIVCKGSTCVFGLYDTQGLAKELHQLYYEGYHGVSLPHKFKIGVGGCPNNCVKPDLNDIGVVGQRVLTYDPEMCRACKVCQVERAALWGPPPCRRGKSWLSRRKTATGAAGVWKAAPLGPLSGREPSTRSTWGDAGGRRCASAPRFPGSSPARRSSPWWKRPFSSLSGRACLGSALVKQWSGWAFPKPRRCSTPTSC